MELVVLADADELALAAARLVRARLADEPDLTVALPAGRTPRGMYRALRALQEEAPVRFSEMRAFAVDELCPPAPHDGYFWRQVERQFLAWADVKPERCHPFRVDAPDLARMCEDYEALIEGVGGLDLIVLGLGPNGHLASNEPGSSFATRTRPVQLLPATVAYILTDAGADPAVSDRAVTLGLATILAAREVVVLVSGEPKRVALRQALEGPITPELPASVLRRHPRALVLADRAAAG